MLTELNNSPLVVDGDFPNKPALLFPKIDPVGVVFG